MEKLKVHKSATGLIDTRKIADTDTGLIVAKKRKLSVSTFFKTDQSAAIAFFMSDMYAKGFNDEQIQRVVNEKYNLEWNMTQVRTMKTLIRKLWRAQMAHDMNEQITEEVNAINVQIKECWEAWERSKKGTLSKTTRKAESQGDVPGSENTYSLEETLLKEDTNTGEVKYMSLINELGKEKRKLLGLYAPEKKEVKGNGNTAIQINVVGGDGQAAQALDNVLFGGTSQPEPENYSVEDAEAEVVTANKQLGDGKQNTKPYNNGEDDIDLEAFFEEIMG